ncbi:FAD-dependent oxidoreductase [Roseovarius sp. EL26]|uniref:FAD-dependent oxidoreductase n=1 Tax=Roseovarius sp. EL26 TaxID=2126672 RepID=UPI000EA3926D|nr:FAD-dependent oxidoreductase [Roseovarius sp. EL26]
MITIAGAGLAGLACAYELSKRGIAVTLFDLGDAPGSDSVARFAGGMLAPWCERESAEEDVITLGTRAAGWWAQITKVTRNGTLVLAAPRDQRELARFALRTTGYRSVCKTEVSTMEPALAGQFQNGLFFGQEAHLDPRQALRDLAKRVQYMGGIIHFDTPAPAQVDLDCTGMAANLLDLRPVRGEMAILRCPEVTISRTIRLLHPRMPLYLVPRGDSHYMIGGTMIESSSTRPPTLRSLTELLNAAYTLHPAFAEASVVELGAGLRPAFPDNLPQLIEQNNTLYLNGLYRHGFLLAPAMAATVADRLAHHTTSEDSNAHHRQCATA